MKIYLAARYSRREELCEYRKLLQEMGHIVTSRWLDGKHQIDDKGKPITDAGEDLVENAAGEEGNQLRLKFANDDYKDVYSCELLIAFTEPPRSDASRGGRHVELGLALAWLRRVWVVGHRENLFCWLEDIRFHKTFESAVVALRKEAE